MQNYICNIRSKIIEILKNNSIENAQYEADIILSNVLKINRTNLYTSLISPITKKNIQKIFKLVEGRLKGEPIQYLIKHCSFYGLDFYIRKGVFIPRPETEILVEETIKLFKSQISNLNSQIYIADIGCGSGCISISIAKNIKNCFIYATDISYSAILCAKKNTRIHNVQNKIKFLKGEYLKPLYKLKNKFHIIVSNPPYIPTDDICNLQKEISYEPPLAIDGGKDGMDFYRNIAKDIPCYIKNSGFVAVEIGKGQRKKIEKIFSHYNLMLYKAVPDFAGIDRVLIFQKNA